MKNLQRLFTLVFAASILWSCEDTIYPELEHAEPQMVIDAWINNKPEPQYIRLSETLPYFDSVSQSGIADTAVYIIDNEENIRYDFTEISLGVYEWTPTPEFPEIGIIMNSYNLNIEIGGNNYYATSVLNRVPEIDSIVFSFKEETIYPEGYYAQFYADDFAGPGDTYWIKAYKNDKYLNKPNEINLAYDAGFSAGSNIDGITFIAFTYLNELRIQTDRPGGFAELFSVPLSNIPTNINSTDPGDQKAIGYFNMSAIHELGEWLDPGNLPVAEL